MLVSVWGVGSRMNGWGTEGSQGNENILYSTVTMDTCHYMLVKIHRMYNTESKPQGTLSTLGDYDVSVSVRLPIGTHVPLWFGMMIIGRPCISGVRVI